MLDTIRDLEKNGILNQEIITMLLTKHEYDLISNQAEWVDQRNTYLIPPFYFKQKKVHFPKLPQFQAMDLVNQEKENRELQFRSRDKPSGCNPRAGVEFHLHDTHANNPNPCQASYDETIDDQSSQLDPNQSVQEDDGCSKNSRQKSNVNLVKRQLVSHETNGMSNYVQGRMRSGLSVQPSIQNQINNQNINQQDYFEKCRSRQKSKQESIQNICKYYENACTPPLPYSESAKKSQKKNLNNVKLDQLSHQNMHKAQNLISQIELNNPATSSSPGKKKTAQSQAAVQQGEIYSIYIVPAATARARHDLPRSASRSQLQGKY